MTDVSFADPGNVAVEKAENGEARLIFYDFGMMDTLPQSTVQGMRKIAFGLLNGSPNPSASEITTPSRPPSPR